ncbi:dienelactone hydrolase family protein [Mesorhizobium sp. KR9-304]|uniref:dienelactone hydrolase family protein n=1 Tax=Mesorhizobium sp. KR9-304 TaxID=3156614 RepID=UPI0032B59EC3
MNQGVKENVDNTSYPTRVTNVSIPPLNLAGSLRSPPEPRGIVVFAHGSGSSRLSPRNVYVAEALNRFGFATLLFDLLTEDEEGDRSNVFDIPLLAERLVAVLTWISAEPQTAKLRIGLFGASTGAAAALVAAASLGHRVSAVVSRGGRPDLAASALEEVRAPTLLIVGGNDHEVLILNRKALTRLAGPRELRIIPGASHLFPEPGALDAVVAEAGAWFQRYLLSATRNAGGD